MEIEVKGRKYQFKSMRPIVETDPGIEARLHIILVPIDEGANFEGLTEISLDMPLTGYQEGKGPDEVVSEIEYAAEKAVESYLIFIMKERSKQGQTLERRRQADLWAEHVAMKLGEFSKLRPAITPGEDET